MKKIDTTGRTGSIRAIMAAFKIRIPANEDHDHSFPPATDRCCPVEGRRLQRLQLESVTIDWCPVCSGIWFDAGELRTLLQSSLNDTPRLLQQNSDKTEGDATIQRRCPVCQELMFKRENRAAEVVIDVCGRCSGIWADGGEFALLFEKYSAEGNPPVTALRKAASTIIDITV